VILSALEYVGGSIALTTLLEHEGRAVQNIEKYHPAGLAWGIHQNILSVL